ncbi:calcium-binding protein [Methylobacterium oryzihabitans]|uniref:Calcium-binding protein n=1 Tax=Methylobacterium oryzihabitans TaxID=2499852 RepID=A0A437P0K0_9HYPH|nr:calcium-binding protein [Methylobacterium oryzihabitans]RVU15804.1 calcium-binding protein [Methylobacterium oryzihabitans]
MSDILFTLQDPDDDEAADRLAKFSRLQTRMQASGAVAGDADRMTVLVAQLLRADIAIAPRDSDQPVPLDPRALLTGQLTIESGSAPAYRLTGAVTEGTATGTEAGDTLLGAPGDDRLVAGAGDDRAFGRDGNDEILGGDGADLLFGEAGDDTLSGGAGNDFLSGGDGHDRLAGDGGDDILDGREGNDTLSGGEGGDDLSGGAGDDILDGGAGTDLLFGNAGDDIITGGGGADIFGFGAGDGADWILDFEADDVIAFNNGAFADFAGVMAASRQDGADVVIAYGDGDTLHLLNVTLSSLTAAQFSFT